MSTPWMTEQAWAEHQRRVRISKMKKGRVRSSTEGRAGGSVSRPVGVMASVTSGHGNCEPVSSLASSPTSQTFFVPGRLPGANDIMSRHRMVYARLKVLWGHTIAQHIRVAKLTPIGYCRIEFVWREANNRRDDDNIIFAKKFVLDALRDTKIIKDDRRKFVHSVTDRVIVDPLRPGVEVTLIPVCVEVT